MPHKNINNGDISRELSDALESYKLFSDDTDAGKHVKTAQYWMGYVNIVIYTMNCHEAFGLVT